MGEAMASIFIISLLLFIQGTSIEGTILFTIANNCSYPIWPGLLPDPGAPELLATGGFLLREGQSVELSSPREWSGRFWGRTLCHEDPASSNINSCATGDCDLTDCRAGAQIIPPYTAAIISGAVDGMGANRYEVSLAYGFNLPVSIVPISQSGTSGEVGCAVDLNLGCPEKMMVKKDDDVIACQSCTAAPGLCTDTALSSNFFKTKCPNADVGDFADDGWNSCMDADYFLITFCPRDKQLSKAKEDTESNYMRWIWPVVGSVITIAMVAVGILLSYGDQPRINCFCCCSNNVNREAPEQVETELQGV